MKAIYRTLKLAIIALIFSAGSLHAQWDTIKNYDFNPSRPSIQDIFFISNTGYAVGQENSSSSFWGQVGLIAKTTDGGITWNNTMLPETIGNDTIIELRSVCFTTPNIGYATAVCFSFTGGFYGSLLKTTDGGTTWSVNISAKNLTNSTTGNSMFFNSIQFISPNIGFIAASFQLSSSGGGQGFIYTTTNAGNNWNSSLTSSITPTSSLFFTSPSIGCAVGGLSNNNVGNSNLMEIESFPGEISRSIDGGNTWTSILTDPLYGFSDVYFPSSQIGYVTGDSIEQYYPTSGNLMKTINGGLNWTVIHTFPHFQPRCVYFINDTVGYIGGRSNYYIGSGLYKTIDGGLTWTAETHPDNNGGKILAITFTTPVTGYAVNDTGNYLVNISASILGNFPTSSCSVFLGPDTTFCQTQGQLFATPGTPDTNYVFSWSPSTGLSDPTSQSPFVNHVSNQQYVVTMTNTVTLCVATDTIVVSAYEWITGPQYICSTVGDSTLLDFGPGATSYFWQFYTDTATNVTNINQNTQTYWATQQGYYLGFANFTGCGALTSYVQVLDTCGTYAWVANVWPGDCNYDLAANNADALQIGLAYNTTGATRPSASNSWVAQPMTDWSQNFVGCNYKHADANGDGTINANDTLPIFLNYGNTHPYRLQPVIAPATAPALYLVANYDTVGLQTLVTVDIRLGTTSIPVDSLYGISFRITADAGLIDTTLTIIDLNNTWLGTMNTDMFGFRKYFFGNGSVDAAESRNNLSNRLGGNGTIGTFFIVTTDNLSGIAICHINVSDITAVTVSQTYLSFNTVNDSVVIDPSHPAGISEMNATSAFSVFPNPGNENVTVQTNSLATEISICDMLGRTIVSVKPNSNSTSINTSQLAEGVYLIRVKNGNSFTTQKLSVTH